MLLAGLSTYTVLTLAPVSDQFRTPASVPEKYETLKACEKQDILWERVQKSAYGELPEYQKFGITQLMAMGMQELKLKENYHSDFAPKDWKKYLHRRGALVKVKIIPVVSKFSGVFQGADCAILRLSLTYKASKSKPVAPGLALKILRDGVHSANVSALVSLDGQGKEFNFFKNPMSNIVPIGKDFGQKLVHKLFRSVSDHPEELVVQDMALINSHGEKTNEAVSPRQMFFVPGPGLKFSSEEHDVRDDFLSIQEGTIIYQLYSVPDRFSKFDYANYRPEMISSLVKESQHIADIVTTSDFIASEFGDDGMFFRHQLRP